MAINCPKCHVDNPDTSRFCGNCATALIPAKPAPPAVTKTIESPARVVAPGDIFGGRYEILERIGAGGMGEVYRALDKSLGRQVAIKILPAAFAEDKERMARFEREAKLLAVMNHPNIAAIHGLEESGGRRFLVLELAEGETLLSRLDKGALPLEDTLEICRQLADGLEAAHEKGVVHRDLKPGNIMLTPEGKIKILDFGLAKAYGGETTSVDIEKSPTITAQMTEPGVVLGTAAYMSPEQARSRPVDKRTDIWSFGCVLYECLTGTRTFHGETLSDTLAHILKGEPHWGKLPQETPTRIRTLLRHCLEKNPRERLHDIADARIEILETISQPSAPETVVIRRPSRTWIISSISFVLVVGALGAFITWHPKPTAPRLSPVRFSLKLEPGQSLAGDRWNLQPTRPAIAISNNGRFLVYCGQRQNPGQQGTRGIYIRRMDQLEATPVVGAEFGTSPFLSPDDQWLGFLAEGKLEKVPIDGGVPALLYAGDWVFGVDWGPDNTIVFSTGPDVGISRIPSEGGKPEVLTIPDKSKEYSHRLPHWLPNGEGVLFTIMRNSLDLQPDLALLDIKTRKWRLIMEGAADGRYIRTGHLVFLRQGTLMAVGFDLDRLEVTGKPLPVIGNVMQALNIPRYEFNSAAGQYALSDSGWLAYVPGGIMPDDEASLVRVDFKGNIQPVSDFKAPFFAPRLSPDGKRIAYTTAGREWRTCIYDLSRGTASPVTSEGWAEGSVWTPDGKGLVVAWSASGERNLYLLPVDGSSQMERLTTSEYPQTPESFAPDGSTLAFVENNPDGLRILLLDMKSRRVTPFLNSNTGGLWADFSPKGQWLAYVSEESGRREVWVRPFPGPGGRIQISKEGGLEPIWSKDGRQLFYRQNAQVWVVDLGTESGFSPGKPRLLFERPGLWWGEPRHWDLWPDGQGFLMVKEDERKPTPVTEMLLVQNWFEELKRLVPAGKK